MKKWFKIITMCAVAWTLALGADRCPVNADVTDEGSYSEKEVYEEDSFVLSEASMAKGSNRYFSIVSESYYSWYLNKTVSPKNIVWSVDGDAIKIKSKTNHKKVKIGAVKEGEATLSVSYELDYGSYVYRYTSSATIYVTNPKLAQKTIGINKHCSDYTTVDITGCNSYSDIECTTSSSKISAYAYRDWWDDTLKLEVYGQKKGDYTVNVKIDGKTFKVKVKVFSAYFKNKASHSVDFWMDKIWHEGDTMLALYKDETEQLKVRGLKSGSKIKWKTSDKKVATVNKDGVVKAKGNGYCTITANLPEGGSISYEVGVASKGAIKAVHYAIKHFGSEYSQAQRMSEGKYDCSSYVYRAYRDAGLILGGDRYNAPTAAELAKWCEKNGYVLYEEDEEVDVTKLLPGDLIFETGEDNGRYKGIYHVDMYTGNYSSLTVERTKSYGDRMYGVIIARVSR